MECPSHEGITASACVHKNQSAKALISITAGQQRENDHIRKEQAKEKEIRDCVARTIWQRDPDALRWLYNIPISSAL